MKRWLELVLVVAAAMGCGDDDAMVPVDGGGDAASADLGDGRDEVTVALRIVDPDDAPLEGVFITADTPSGRVATTSDAGGEASVTVRVADGERVVWQYAKEGYRIDAVERVYEVAAPPPAMLDVVLSPLVAGLGERTNIAMTLSGMPTDARACTAFDGFSVCFAAGDASPNVTVPLGFIGSDVRVYVLDASDELHDFATVELTETGSDFEATVAIDGSPEIPVAESRDFRLLVPDGETSRLADSELSDRWAWWVGRGLADDRTSASVCGRATRDGNAILTRCHFLDVTEPTVGGVVVWADSEIRSQSGFSSRYFGEAALPDEIELLGTAVASGGPSVGGTFAWESPAIPDAGVATSVWFVATFTNSSGVTHRQLVTQRTEGVTLPALPDGFDTSASYPSEGAGGALTVRTLVFDGPIDTEGSQVLMNSVSEPLTVTF